jgi:heat-inducible transcriptional repressor
MAELTALGYLEQPHTSAGRIPSEAGYRFYVNTLLDRYNMTQQELRQINANLSNKLAELDQILNEASRLASAFTQYPSIAARPRANGLSVVRFDTMYIDSRAFALMMLFSDGAVRTRHIRSSFPLLPEELEALTRLLNTYLAGRSAEEITLPLILEMERYMGPASSVVGPLVKLVYECMKEQDAGDLRVEGVNNLLSIPDYSDPKELKTLIHLLEEKDELLDVMFTDEGEVETESESVRVLIGNETSVRGMGNSTLVYRTVQAGGKVLGVIGVVGPRRMDYSKVISIIESLALGIDNLLTDGSDTEEI